MSTAYLQIPSYLHLTLSGQLDIVLKSVWSMYKSMINPQRSGRC